MRRKHRRLVFKLTAPVLLFPLILLYLLRQSLEAAAGGIDWLVEGRSIPMWLCAKSEDLETWSAQ